MLRSCYNGAYTPQIPGIVIDEFEAFANVSVGEGTVHRLQLNGDGGQRDVEVGS